MTTPAGPATPLTASVVGGDWYATHVAVRLQEFFFPHTPWQRRLWDAGTVSTLKEVLETARWQHQNVLSSSTVQWLAKELERITGTDPGVGDAAIKKALAAELATSVPYDTRHWRRLEQLIVVVRTGYLARWAVAVDSATPPGAERTARAIAAHLLDQGYSQRFLYSWVQGHISFGNDLGSLIADAITLDDAADTNYEVLLPFAAMPKPDVARASGRWLTGPEARYWVDARGGLPDGSAGDRYAGAFTYEVRAKDPYAVARVMESVLDRILSRSRHVPGYANLHALGKVWLYDPNRHQQVHVFPVGSQHRGTYVRSLLREMKLHDVAPESTALDDALELASGLNSGSPGPAIAAGWSALESLLYSPGDPQDGKEGRGVVACDRAAALVTCSWPRAELTPLTHQNRPAAAHAPAAGRPSTPPGYSTAPLMGALAAERRTAALTGTGDDGSVDPTTFAGLDTNISRCSHLLANYENGRYLTLTHAPDMASQERMLALLRTPRDELGDVRRTIQHAFRRMYRYRNIVVHGGASSTAGLDGALRIVAPLAGAALDRIAHAALSQQTDPLTLAARAELHLDLVGTRQSPPLHNLLG